MASEQLKWVTPEDLNFTSLNYTINYNEQRLQKPYMAYSHHTEQTSEYERPGQARTIGSLDDKALVMANAGCPPRAAGV